MEIVIDKAKQELISLLWTGDEESLVYNVVLAKEGASVDMQGLLLGNNRHELQLTVNVTHAAPHTTSKVAIAGVLTDKVQVNVDGLVTINTGAKQSIARLDAHLILLSNQAKGKVIPSLEILENDVKAGHAAAVGKIDPLQLFYLESRGLDPKTAKQLIIEGFLDKTIQSFPEALKQKARKYIQTYVTAN